MQLILVSFSGREERCRMIAITMLFAAMCGCSTGAGEGGPTVIEAEHTNVHGTIVQEIAFGESAADLPKTIIRVTPIRADREKRRLLVRVTDLKKGRSKQGWVNEGEHLLGYPGIGPSGAKFLRLKRRSAVFEFGFAQ